jgi:ABC-type nitrate/sulfonate/bicarbonate transport system permease component
MVNRAVISLVVAVVVGVSLGYTLGYVARACKFKPTLLIGSREAVST